MIRGEELCGCGASQVHGEERCMVCRRSYEDPFVEDVDLLMDDPNGDEVN